MSSARLGQCSETLAENEKYKGLEYIPVIEQPQLQTPGEKKKRKGSQIG